MMDAGEKSKMANDKFSFEQTINQAVDHFIRSNSTKLYKFILQVAEKPLIENVLDRNEGNQSKAAKILGINRNTLHTKIKRLNIDVRKFK